MVDVFQLRRDKIDKTLDLSSANILEIGAFDRPTFLQPEYNIKFLDYRTTEELRQLARGSPNSRNERLVPHVDYVVNSNYISQTVDQKFDLVIGNHLIEHIPNLIEWLIDLTKIISDNGKVFLSVPDRRYTFDYLRRETTFIDCLRVYYDGVKSTAFWSLLDARYYERPNVVGVDGWHPEVLQKKINQKRYNWADAIELAKRESAAKFIDIHHSVFTTSSFIRLFDDFMEASVAPFLIESIEDVPRGALEFHVVLARNPNFSVMNQI